MQTKEQVHNANVLQEAIKMQNVATKAENIANAINEFLLLDYKALLQPDAILALFNARDFLVNVNVRKEMEELAKQLK